MKELIEKRLRPVKGAGTARGTKEQVRKAIESNTPFKVISDSESSGVMMFALSTKMPHVERAHMLVMRDGTASISIEIGVERAKSVADLGKDLARMGIR